MTDQKTPDDIGRLYRSVSSESAPAELDDAVLRLAASEAKGTRWDAFSNRWLGVIATCVAAGACTVWVLTIVLPSSPVGPPETTSVVEDFSAAAADGRDRFREIGDSASAQIPAGDPSVADNALHCSSDEMANPADWTACIDALREQGLADAATEEMRRFFSVHGVKPPVVE